MNIYIIRGGKTYGPYSEPTARQFFEQGLFSAKDLARMEGAEDWEPLGDVMQGAWVEGADAPEPAMVRESYLYQTPGLQTGLSTWKKNLLVAIFVLVGALCVLVIVDKYFNISSKYRAVLHPRKAVVAGDHLLRNELAGKVVISISEKSRFSLDSAQIAVYSAGGVRAILTEKNLVYQSEVERLKPLLDAAKLERDNKCEIYLNLIGNSANGSMTASAQALEAQGAYEKANLAYYNLQVQYKKYTTDS